MLPRRVRFYHGKIAARNLGSGADYEKLKDVVIIMILPYDPFGLERMVYTMKNQCVEEPGMEYENEVNEELREIHRMAETVMQDPEVGGMRIQIADEVINLSEENAKLIKEIMRLREELDPKNDVVKQPRTDKAMRR